MNEDGLLLLSTVMELLVVFSIAIAILTVWMNSRAKRAARPKDSEASQPRANSAGDKQPPTSPDGDPI